MCFLEWFVRCKSLKNGRTLSHSPRVSKICQCLGEVKSLLHLFLFLSSPLTSGNDLSCSLRWLCVSFLKSKMGQLTRARAVVPRSPRFFYHLHWAHVLRLYFLNKNKNLRNTILKTTTDILYYCVLVPLSFMKIDPHFLI